MKKLSMPQSLRLLAVLSAMLPVMMVSACVGTSAPASVSGATKALKLNGLAEAQGKTRKDQDKIDDIIARGCAIDAVSRARCDAHSEASDARLSELAALPAGGDQ